MLPPKIEDMNYVEHVELQERLFEFLDKGPQSMDFYNDWATSIAKDDLSRKPHKQKKYPRPDDMRLVEDFFTRYDKGEFMSLNDDGDIIN